MPLKANFIKMPTLIYDNEPFEIVRKGVKRKKIYTDKLITVLLDFTNGPWDKPEPFHSHPHKQTSYIATGEIIFFCEGEKEQNLKAGDMFAVPSGLKHTIQLLSKKARLIDSFYPARKDFLI